MHVENMVLCTHTIYTHTHTHSLFRTIYILLPRDRTRASLITFYLSSIDLDSPLSFISRNKINEAGFLVGGGGERAAIVPRENYEVHLLSGIYIYSFFLFVYTAHARSNKLLDFRVKCNIVNYGVFKPNRKKTYFLNNKHDAVLYEYQIFCYDCVKAHCTHAEGV